MQTDRVSWNMKPGRSNLSEKKKNIECACVRVSKLGRRRSTKKVGDGDEAQNLAKGMRSATQNTNQKKKGHRKVFSQEDKSGKKTHFFLIIQ